MAFILDRLFGQEPTGTIELPAGSHIKIYVSVSSDLGAEHDIDAEFGMKAFKTTLPFLDGYISDGSMAGGRIELTYPRGKITGIRHVAINTVKISSAVPARATTKISLMSNGELGYGGVEWSITFAEDAIMTVREETYGKVVEIKPAKYGGG